MDRSTAFSRFSEIFFDVMDVDDPGLSEQTTAEDVEEWDSLSHVRLIVAVERGFGVKFTNAEIERLTCVGDLIDAVIAKAA
jgi:acyl carrier protein